MEEEIVVLNLYVKDGLKDGMILKILWDVFEVILINVNKIDFINIIINKDIKCLVVFFLF